MKSICCAAQTSYGKAELGVCLEGSEGQTASHIRDQLPDAQHHVQEEGLF